MLSLKMKSLALCPQAATQTHFHPVLPCQVFPIYPQLDDDAAAVKN